MPLTQDEPKAVVGEVRSEGLVYRVLPDGVSVALVGWYGAAPEGDVLVPASVTSGEDSYDVTCIGEEGQSVCVFADSKVTTLTLPASVQEIIEGALSGCPTLARIEVSSKNESFASFDGMLFSKDLSSLLTVPEGKEGAAHIPDQTTSVPASAFSQAPGLQSVEVGEGSVTFASRNGVLYSKDLTTLIACPPGAGKAAVIPAEVERIGEQAFAGCSLASITALGFVREIASDAFIDEAKANALVALPAGEDYESRKTVWETAGFTRFAEPAKPGDTSAPSAPETPESDQQASGLAYTLLDDYTLSVSWQGTSDPASDLEIPTTAGVGGVSYQVSTIASGAFANRGTLASVKLPSTITTLGDATFAGCANLQAVTLPEGLRTIGERAFEATSLTNVWLPASITSLGARAFAACSSLTRIVAQSTPQVASDVLAECANTTVYCPAGSEDSWNVGLPAANNHLAPYGITLPEEPLALAVDQSASLLDSDSLKAPEPIEVAYAYAAKPVSIDADGTATGKAPGTSEVVVTLALDNKELARATRTVEVKAAQEPQNEGSAREQQATVPILSQVRPLSLLNEGISTYAAEGETFTVNEFVCKITSASYPFTVEIGQAPNTSSSGPCSIPSYVDYAGERYNVTAVAAYGFYSTVYSDIYFPDSVTTIREGAFYGCNELQSITIPSSVTTVEPYAFAECKLLSSITLSDSMIFDPQIVAACVNLQRINVTPTNSRYASDNGVLYSKDMTELVKYPQWRGASSYDIPSGVTTITSNAFEGVGQLETVTFPTSLKSIQQYAFMSSSLESIAMPSSVTSLGYMAFYGCNSLTEISIPASVATMGTSTFSACTKLTNVTLANGLKSIGPSMFQGCTSLSSITIPSSVTTIGSSAFSGCTALTSMTLPSGITQLPSGVFKQCKFQDLYVQGTVATIDATAFSSFVGLSTLTVHLPKNASRAVWEQAGISSFDVKYSVTFNSQGGSAVAAQEVAFGSKVIKPADPTKTGCTFSGWYTEAGYTNSWDFNTTVSGEMTLYARWSLVSYTITYNLGQGATLVGPVRDYTVMTESFTLNEPARKGYTFVGWSGTGLTGTANKTVTIPKGSTGNRSYTANWTANTYDVTLNGIGGTGGTSRITATYDSAMPSITKPSKTGYTFAGYFDTNAATGGTQYYTAAGASARNWDKAATATLYARWTLNSYTLSFNTQSGSAAPSSQTVNYGAKATAVANPTRTGYTFGGWYTGANGAGTKWNFSTSTMPAANTTLYAKWTPITYTITYTLNSGSVSGNPSSYTIESDDITLAAPTRTGYTFVGWSGTGLTGTANKTVTIPKGSTGNRSYTANWTANTYDVTLNGIGGTGGTSRITATYDSAMPSITKPSKTGYTFIGYFDTNATTGGTQYYTAAGASARNWDKAAIATLYARWTLNSYTLSFNTQSGSAAPSSQTVNYGAKATSVADPTRTGYTFGGWYTGANGAGTKWDFSTSTMPAANTTLYAKWTPITYSISYTLNSGSVSGNPSSYTIESDDITLATPTRTGYTFAGWSGTGLTGAANKTVTIPKGSTGNRSYTANWTANTYTIVFNGNGNNGGSMTNQSMTYGQAKNLSLNAFTKTGYTFAGWAKTATGAVEYANGASVSNLATSGTISLYAKWTANTYSVHFNASGGSGTMENQGFAYDSAAKALRQNTFTRTGYTFAGWATSSGSTQVAYTDAAMVKNLVPSGTVELYAVWTLNKYNVTFNSQGGSAVAAQEVAYGSKVTKPTDPKKTGYTFGGWYKEAACTNAWDFNATVSGALTLYAKWTANAYTVVFNPNGGAGVMANESFTYGVAKALFPNAFSKTGYTFAGWTTAQDGSGTKYSDKQSVSNLASIGTTTLYAQWEANSYTIEFNGNGNTSGTMSDVAMIYDTAKSLPTSGFSKTGYTFAGWATTASGAVVYSNGQSVENLTPTANGVVTLYAKWTPNTYTITFDGNGESGGSTATLALQYDTAKKLNANGFTKTGYSFAGWAKTASGAVEYTDGQSVKNLTATANGKVTLYAKWTPNTYTVAYAGNGNTSGATASQTFTYDASSNLALNGFAKTGYTFVEWNTLSNGTGTAYAAGSSQKNLATSGTFQLYARWKANSYAVRFNASGGSGTMANQTFTYDAAALPLTKNAFTKTGYTFAGWSVSSGGTTVAYSDAAAVRNLTAEANKVIDLYAVWTPVGYNVAFNSQGGSAVAAQEVAYGSKITKPTDPTKPGYTFAGWYKEEACTNVWNFNTMTVSGATTLYAKWTPNTYTITFDGNNATSGSMTALSMTYGQEKNLPAVGFVRTGYTFAGWTTDQAGTGVEYADKQSVSNLTEVAGGSVTLYAQWAPISYQVHFNANGGLGSMSDQTLSYGTSAQLAPNTFTRVGYVFNGWALSSSGNVVYADTASVINLTTSAGQTVDLYAIWIPATFTLSFDSRGGSTVDSVSATFGSKPHAPTNPTKEGYVFVGWYKEAACTNAWSFETDTMPAENVVLYAKWTLVIDCSAPLSATVTIDASGVVTPSTPQAFTSATVEPLNVTSIASTQQPGAVQVIPDAAVRDNAKISIAPAGKPAVLLGLGESVQAARLTNFTIPAKGSLSLVFGLQLPSGGGLNFCTDAQEVAKLVYTVSAA